MNKIHIPVLLNETIDSLNITPYGFYIDCTLGDGGHSIEILNKLSEKGLLFSFDCDQNAIELCKRILQKELSQKRIGLSKRQL